MCKCGFCCEDENFAYFVIGDTEKNSRIVMRSGGGMGAYNFIGDIQPQ